MKKLLPILIAAIGFVSQMSSQDTLFLNSGRTINGKVVEVGTDLIKYKKQGRPDGPVYDVNKTDIVTIHYADGSKDTFQGETNSSTTASSSSNTVLVHVAGQDDQVVQVGSNNGPGIFANSAGSQVLNTLLVGAEILAVSNANQGMRKKNCAGGAHYRGHNNGSFMIPLVIGLVAVASHIR